METASTDNDGATSQDLTCYLSERTELQEGTLESNSVHLFKRSLFPFHKFYASQIKGPSWASSRSCIHFSTSVLAQRLLFPQGVSSECVSVCPSWGCGPQRPLLPDVLWPYEVGHGKLWQFPIRTSASGKSMPPFSISYT